MAIGGKELILFGFSLLILAVFYNCVNVKIIEGHGGGGGGGGHGGGHGGGMGGHGWGGGGGSHGWGWGGRGWGNGRGYYGGGSLNVNPLFYYDDYYYRNPYSYFYPSYSYL